MGTRFRNSSEIAARSFRPDFCCWNITSWVSMAIPNLWPSICLIQIPFRGGNGLYAIGTCFDIFDSASGQRYRSEILEYDREVKGDKPHLILLGTQENTGHDGSIMYGELVLLLAAMWNRAYQAAVVEEGPDIDVIAHVEDEKDLLFKDERRFPVSNFYRLGAILILTWLGHYGLSCPSPTCTNLLCLHGQRGPGDSKIQVIQLGEKGLKDSGFPLSVSLEQPLGRSWTSATR